MKRAAGVTAAVIAAAVAVLAVVAFAVTAGVLPRSAQPSPAATAFGLSGTCHPAPGPASVPGDVSYVLTVTNAGPSPVQVTQVAVIFSVNGREIGSDDPAQQDFPGDAEPISHFNPVLIGAGQSVTVRMETAAISGAAGGWSCSFGGWSA